MQLNVRQNARARQFLQFAGVPAGLLEPFTLDLQKQCRPFAINAERTISTTQQIQRFQQLRQPTTKPFTAIFASQANYLNARQAATVIFWAHLRTAINAGITLPVWHLPDNSFINDWREKYLDGLYRAPSLLVLDGLYQETSQNKLDKVREILQLSDDRPRLLLLHSSQPLVYCTEVLAIKPQIMLQFGSSTSKVIKI